MVRNQDDASFVSWASTLHPESAPAIMNPTILRRQPNPLVAVYQEIRSDDFDYYHDDNVPVAVQVVAVNDDDEDEEHENNHNDVEEGRPTMSTLPSTSPSEQRQQDASTDPTVYRPKPWQHSSTIDLIFGFMFSFVAWLTTIKIEIAAFINYVIAASFHYLGEEIFKTYPVTGILRSISLLISSAFMILDAILLMVSVLITEILGAIALFLCTLLGGQQSGIEWHRFIRRSCHLTRWGFRKCLTRHGWKPERIFPIPESLESASLRPTTRTSSHNQDRSNIPYSDDLNQQHTQEVSTQQSNNHNNNNNNTGAGHYDDGISTLTATTLTPADLPVVTVSAENVHVLNDSINEGEDDFNDDDSDGFFTKNTQRVTID